MSFDPVSYAMGKKAGGGGGGVTVEPLTVTENGTYTAPSGKAYSPVTVGVQGRGWKRPSDWPDLDSITMPSTDCIYLTYDLRKTPGIAWIGIYVVTEGNAKWTLERGTLDSGGIFTAIASQEFSSYETCRQTLNESDGDVQLFRITAESGANITECFFRSNTDTQASNFRNDYQPCVERRGKAHITNTNSLAGFGPTQNTFLGGWIEREDFYFDGSGALTNNSYQGKPKLRSLALSGPKVEASLPVLLNLTGLLELSFPSGAATSYSLANTFRYFRELENLDLSGLNTSAVTNANMFLANNTALKSLDLSGLDLSAVTTKSSIIDAERLKSFKATGMKISTAVNIQVSLMSALEDFWPWVMLEDNINFSNCIYLSVDSLLRIIDALPTVSTPVTLTLGQNNTNKLTAEQIAVATEKGWTVA